MCDPQDIIQPRRPNAQKQKKIRAPKNGQIGFNPMNPPLRNWNKEDQDEEKKHYTYDKPNYGDKNEKNQKTKIYNDDDAIVELL